MTTHTDKPGVAPSIPNICVGGIRIANCDHVECLKSPFHCEYLTVIENKYYCHHPRALEIAAGTEEARRKNAGGVPWWLLTDAGRRPGTTSNEPPR